VVAGALEHLAINATFNRYNKVSTSLAENSHRTVDVSSLATGRSASCSASGDVSRHNSPLLTDNAQAAGADLCVL
jgi:hypothetical protein